MKLNIKLLSKICKTHGTSGFEKEIRDFLISELNNIVDEIKIDNMGNLIAIKKGKSSDKKIMTAAHMDEIGFMVKNIDSNGFIKFQTLGGFDPKTLTSMRVLVHGKKDLLGVMGAKPIHIMSPDERTKAPKIEDFFIDLGMKHDEVEKYISVGDPITRIGDLEELGECICSKSIDNRVSVFIQLEALKNIKEIPYDWYAVFTVQEEVGIRGATAATLDIKPDFGIAIDTTIAFDVPGSTADTKVTELGKGTAIKIMDSSSICDYRMVNYMKQTADKHKIKYQTELLSAGGTDTSAIQKMTAGGSISGAISIPTRHIHQTIEMANKEDILLSIKLLTSCIQNLNTFDWKH